MGQAGLFAASVIVGIVVGTLYFLESNLVLKTNIFAVTLIFDIILGGAAIVGVVAVSYLNDGILRPFMLLGEACGIGLIYLLFSTVKSGLQKLKKRERVAKKRRNDFSKKSSISLSDFVSK